MSVAKAVDKSMWEGTSLPNDLKCDCLKGRPHHVADYKSNPIIKYAKEHPAGSSKFFHTDFQGAFRRSGKEVRLTFSFFYPDENIVEYINDCSYGLSL